MDSSSCGPETKSSNTDLHVKGFLFRKTQLSRETKHPNCGGFPCVGKKISQGDRVEYGAKEEEEQE